MAVWGPVGVALSRLHWCQARPGVLDERANAALAEAVGAG